MLRRCRTSLAWSRSSHRTTSRRSGAPLAPRTCTKSGATSNGGCGMSPPWSGRWRTAPVRVVETKRRQSRWRVTIRQQRGRRQPVRQTGKQESTDLYAGHIELGAILPDFIHQIGRSRWSIETRLFQTMTTDSHRKQASVHQSHPHALVALTMIRLFGLLADASVSAPPGAASLGPACAGLLCPGTPTRLLVRGAGVRFQMIPGQLVATLHAGPAPAPAGARVLVACPPNQRSARSWPALQNPPPAPSPSKHPRINHILALQNPLCEIAGWYRI